MLISYNSVLTFIHTYTQNSYRHFLKLYIKGLIYKRITTSPNYTQDGELQKRRLEKIENIIRSSLWCAYMVRLSAALTRYERTTDNEEDSAAKTALLDTISDFSIYVKK